MKTKDRSDIKISGSLGGEEIELSLDENSLPHLMNMYIRMYQNPEMATLREIATNARDSNIAAGKSKVPIKITLPTKLDPVLTIEDSGVGLNADDFRNIYSKYGASTKRTSNKVTGSLGIGCKAPLAYTASFTVEGYKDGLKTTAAVTRDGKAGKIHILNPEGTPTTRENGVIVKVPAPVDNNFLLYSERLFQFWPKGSVLVNGEEIPPIEGLQITKNILISKSLKTNYIVMGGVPYEYHDDILARNNDDNYKVVAYVEMGSVEFAPSRETLELTPDTKKRIEQIADEANTGLSVSIQKKIDKAKSKVEAAKIMCENIGLVDMRSTKFTYKGEDIPYGVEATVISTYSGSWKQSDHDKSRSVYINSFTKQLIVKDFTPQAFHASHKKKIEHYVQENNIYDPATINSNYPRNMRYFLCFPEMPEGLLDWIDPKHVVDWEVIRKIKLPSVGRGGVRVAGTYQCYTQDGPQGHVEEDDVDTLHPLLYTSEYREGLPRHHTKLLNRVYPQWTIATMAGNRVNKFKRLFPKAVWLENEIVRLTEEFKKGLTKEEKEYMQYVGEKNMLERFDPSKIKDQELVRIIRLVKNEDHVKVASLANDLRMHFEGKDPFKAYPLIQAAQSSYYSWRNDSVVEHATMYINAAYTAQNGNGKKGK